MDIVDGEDLIRSQSVYEKIKHNKYQIGQVGDKQRAIKDEIKEFAKFEKRLLKQRVARENIETLAKNAPSEI
jgi:dynactin complex subunit